MLSEITLTLPMPPSINHYWRRSGHHIHISEKGRAYRAEVIKLIKEATSESFGDARVSVIMQLIPNTRRKYDIDNRVKALADAITHAGLWDDDEQIDVLHIIKRPPQKGEGVVLVTIQKIAQKTLAQVK